jgi:hypothetical protein
VNRYILPMLLGGVSRGGYATIKCWEGWEK